MHTNNPLARGQCIGSLVVSLESKGMFAARGTRDSVFTATNGTSDDEERETRTD